MKTVTKYLVVEIKHHMEEIERFDSEGECIAYIESLPSDMLGDAEFSIVKVYTTRR